VLVDDTSDVGRMDVLVDASKLYFPMDASLPPGCTS
jgi:hypothetical protein